MQLGKLTIGWGAQSRQPLSVERDLAGNVFYTMISSAGTVNSPTNDRQKIEIILRNPAALKVFKLNADLGSLGKVALFKEDKFVEINALRNYQKKPNKHQTWKQFFWDYFFYNPLGTAFLWRSNNTNLTYSKTDFYWLNPAKMDWEDIQLKLDKLDLSDKAVNDLEKLSIKYRFRDGSYKDIPLKEIQSFCDLSNSVSENWYKGNSSIDALYNVIANSQEAISAKQVNLDYSKKYFVTGTQDPKDVTQIPMGETEKRNIKDKLADNDPVKVTKSMIEIRRFVDDIAKLKLDDSYLADYFIIGSMFGIPRDVLEANIKGSTFENQEKSTGKHISYSIQPKADDLMEWLGDFLGMDLRMQYNHLPFMQYVEMDRADVFKTKAEAFKIFVENGLDPKDTLTLLGLEYEGAIRKVDIKSQDRNQPGA